MIELQDLSMRAGSFSLENIHLRVPRGSYAVLMGATGQGKTSLLEVICGLKPVVSGRVHLSECDVTHWKPADRGVGYVPQDLALFPTISVRGHLEFALRVRRWSREKIRERVATLASQLGIESLLDRSVQYLSGGEAQRVAIGRAISFEPQVLLMDEPLNALDEETRDRLCALLRSIHARGNLTTIHVTHHRSEAQQVADKFYLLEKGQVYERPLQDLEVVDFSPRAADSSPLKSASPIAGSRRA